MAKYKLPKIEELLEAGVHYGHQIRRWNPKMEPYIYSVKKNVHIIDLEKTEELLKEACEYLYTCAKEGKQIVFVGTKKQARETVKIEAKRCGAHYVTERWIGGTITNFKVIKKNIDKLINLIRQKETGELEKYTKKERLLIDREIEKLQRNIGGIVNLKATPDVLFVVDAKREKTAIREAKSAGVPVVALIDTNCDPSNIKYVIPGNDDAIKSVALVLKVVADALEHGYKDFDTAKKEPVVVVADEVTPVPAQAEVAQVVVADPPKEEKPAKKVLKKSLKKKE